MVKFADLIEQHQEELFILEALDAGKLLHLKKIIDIPAAINFLHYYAGAADKIHGQTRKCSVAPALAAGCTMIVKPVEKTPLPALYYAILAKEAGIPDGVLNAITGFGPTAGAAICSHMDVEAVNIALYLSCVLMLLLFTGSTEVCRLVVHAAARSNLKPVSLELGGKCPLIIFSDADVNMAVDIAKKAIFYNKVKFVWLGPVFLCMKEYMKSSLRRLLKVLKAGLLETLLIQTLIKDLRSMGINSRRFFGISIMEDMLIAKEEIFGPVMSLMKFKTIEEAIEKANNTIYGLAAGILTNDLNTANRVSRLICAGMIWINCYSTFDRDCPYGGYKASGFWRDLGLQALENYLQEKTVNHHYLWFPLAVT
ncbi:hypothetical protein HPP92_008690 [Vanilla planifolia]|uniref:Aldehyde dehydrogenase domain-containing protein n=1 Tax=Vanilla planifolia TaxID=51239 RepID=A0A835R2X3_VANPL|nr:hypothetical protein HPP92_008690 [Vanilla planifolia]